MTTLESLLQRLRIQSIYWVDDENASPEELDVDKLADYFATQLVKGDEAQRKLALGELNRSEKSRPLGKEIGERLKVSEVDVEGDIVELLKARLDKCVEDPKAILNQMLAALPRPLSPLERQGLVSVFKDAEGWEWHELSFAKWQEQHEAILDQHSQSADSALLIVDLQNDREASMLTGKQVLEHWAQRIVNSPNLRSIYVLALTSTYKQNEELVAGRRFTNELFNEEKKKPSLPVLILSKDRLSTNGDVNEDSASLVSNAFAEALSRLRAFVLHTKLAEEVGKLFLHSIKEAFLTLQQLSIEEMLFSVSSSSFKEGASEIDTLVRMASIAQREALLNGLLKKESIRAAIIELRGLHPRNHVKATDIDSTDGLDRLRCSELHDPSEVVNNLFSPLSTGDIFEITRDDRSVEYYVLASNACDLMLRSNTGKRKLDTGLLLLLELKSGDSESSYPLTPFPMSSPLAGQQIVANLLRMWTIPLTVLDLCWTNSKGYCIWSRDQKTPDPLVLLPAQQLRYEKVCEQFRPIFTRSKLSKVAPGIACIASFDKESRELKKANFRVRRIGRLASSFAADLSGKLAQIIGRPSQEHDFSALP